MPRPIVVTGGLYFVDDSYIRFGTDPTGRRVPHKERRVVLVVSGTKTASDPAWPLVLICPCSSQRTLATPFCVLLPTDQAPGLKKTWIRVPALMPLAKEFLQDFIQPVQEDILQEVQARIAEYLGLLDDPDDA